MQIVGMIKKFLMAQAFPKGFRFQYGINCHPTKPFHERRPLYLSATVLFLMLARHATPLEAWPA